METSKIFICKTSPNILYTAYKQNFIIKLTQFSCFQLVSCEFYSFKQCRCDEMSAAEIISHEKLKTIFPFFLHRHRRKLLDFIYSISSKLSLLWQCAQFSKKFLSLSLSKFELIVLSFSSTKLSTLVVCKSQASKFQGISVLCEREMSFFPWCLLGLAQCATLCENSLRNVENVSKNLKLYSQDLNKK